MENLEKTFEEFLQENFTNDITEYDMRIRIQEIDNKKNILAVSILPVGADEDCEPIQLDIKGDHVYPRFVVEDNEVKKAE